MTLFSGYLPAGENPLRMLIMDKDFTLAGRKGKPKVILPPVKRV
jgi:hypothetical protein